VGDIVALIVAPIIVFMVIVAPIWLILHYRSKKHLNQGLSQEEFHKLQELAQQAEKMSERIHTLEAILDSDVPDWRKKV
jgi:phage shock protein B